MKMVVMSSCHNRGFEIAFVFFLNWCSFSNRSHKIVKKDTKKVKGLGGW